LDVLEYTVMCYKTWWLSYRKLHLWRNKRSLNSKNSCYHSVQNFFLPFFGVWNLVCHIKGIHRLMKFVPKWEEVTRVWRKFLNEERHDFCSSPNAVRVIKSRRVRLAGNVARMMEMCVQDFGEETWGKKTIRLRWDDIRIFSKAIGSEGVE